MVKKGKNNIFEKNRHKIRIYSLILLYLRCQKVKVTIYDRFIILNIITKIYHYERTNQHAINGI